MKVTKIAAVVAALMAAATTLAPPSSARMQLGNYDLLTNRYDRASWVWFVALLHPGEVAGLPQRRRATPAEVLRLLRGQGAPGRRPLHARRRGARRAALFRVQHAHPRDLLMGRGHAGGHHRLALRRRLQQRPARQPVLDLRTPAPLSPPSRERACLRATRRDNSGVPARSRHNSAYRRRIALNRNHICSVRSCGPVTVARVGGQHLGQPRVVDQPGAQHGRTAAEHVPVGDIAPREPLRVHPVVEAGIAVGQDQPHRAVGIDGGAAGV